MEIQPNKSMCSIDIANMQIYIQIIPNPRRYLYIYILSMYIILFIYIIMINDAPVHIIIYILYEIHIDTYNVVYRLVSWASIVRIFSKIIEYPVNGGGGPLLWHIFFSDPFFSGRALFTFIHLSLGKAGPFTLESHIHGKSLKCKVPQIMKCLIKPLLENSSQTMFQGGTPWVTQILNNIYIYIIGWMVLYWLYCAQKCLGWQKNKKHLYPPFFG